MFTNRLKDKNKNSQEKMSGRSGMEGELWFCPYAYHDLDIRNQMLGVTNPLVG